MAVAEASDLSSASRWQPGVSWREIEGGESSRRWAVRLLGLLALLYLAGVANRWYIVPDSSVYLLLSDSLVSGEGYTISGQPHTKYPHGFPLLLAGLQSVGLGSMWEMNLVMVLLAFALIATIYFVLREQVRPDVALWTTVAVAAGYEMFAHAHWLLSEVPYMLLAYAGLLSLLRGLRGNSVWLVLGVLALTASCWFRVIGLTLAGGAMIGLLLERTPDRRWRAWATSGALACGLAATAAALFYIDRVGQASGAVSSYAAEASQVSSRGMLGVLLAPLVNLFNSGEELQRLFIGQEVCAWSAVLTLWIPITVGVVLQIRQGRWLLAFAMTGYLASILVVRAAPARYLLPAGPLMLVFCLQGLDWLVSCIPACRQRGWAVCCGFVLMIVVMNIPKDVRMVSIMHSADMASKRSEWPPLVEASTTLRRHGAEKARFAAPGSAATLSYLSEVPCYQVSRETVVTQPTIDEALDQLRREGVNMIVLERFRVPLPYFAMLAEQLPRRSDFRSVLKNRDFEIYALTPEVDDERRSTAAVMRRDLR